MKTSEFRIAFAQKQYKTYTLSDQAANSSLEVVPERGGIITSWRVQDQELLYLDRERLTNPELTVRGGIPILFPICGNLPDNTYTYQDVPYSLKQHGFARDIPWNVVDQVTEDRAAMTLELKSNEKTKALYPFDFDVSFTYKLKGSSLEILQRYTNHSDKTMPFSSGLHPYFWAPDKTRLRFEIPGVQYRDHRTQQLHPFTGLFDPNLDEIDVVFEQLTGLAATAIDNSRRLRLTVCYNSSYSSVVFWTLKGKDFYCLEPWSAPRNALNTGRHLTRLEPGASCEMSVSMTANFF